MSLQVTTVNGFATWKFRHNIDAGGEGLIDIDRLTYPLEDFCSATTHFLLGGDDDWADGTPDPVGQALDALFEQYEKVDGKWVRKTPS